MSSWLLGARLRQYLSAHDTLSQLALAGGVGLLLGAASLLLSPILTFGVLVAIGVVLVTLKRPELAVLGILVLTSTVVFEDALPLIPIGVGSLHIPDLILAALFALLVLRLLVEPDFRWIRTPLDLPLLAFYGLALLATVLGVLFSGVEFNLAFREVRTITYYLLFFVLTNLMREKAQLLLLLRGMVWLALLVAGVMVAQFILGDSVSLLPGRVETLETADVVHAGITRVLPPGQSIILMMFIALSLILTFEGFRFYSLIRFVQGVLLGAALIITFNRNFWVIVGVSFLISAYLIRGVNRQRFITWGLIVALLLAVALVIIFQDPDSQVAGLILAFLDRFSTLGTSATLNESSLESRYPEYEHAIPRIISSPILGLGLGARYRPLIPGIDWAEAGGRSFDGRGYIHNGHLWIAMKAGLPAYFCLIWLSFVFLWRGLRCWRDVPDPPLKASMLGFSLTYLGVIMGAIVNPMFMQWSWTPLIGVMMGFSEAVVKALSSDGHLTGGQGVAHQVSLS